MPDSPSSKFRDYRGTKGQIDDADSPGKEKKQKKSAPARSRGTSLDQAMKSKRDVDGVPTYGPPMSKPGIDDEVRSALRRRRNNQSTDSSQ